MSEVPMMTCDFCKKEFPADPRACLEGGIDATFAPEEGEEWKGEPPVTMAVEDVAPEVREQIKRNVGLDDKQLERLLTTGKVDDLGVIVCLECQAKAEWEDV